MESPLTEPGVASIYDEISERPSRSFEALDLCYSEDVSTSSSPLVGQSVPFIPMSAEGAPSFPESALAGAPMEDSKTTEDNASFRLIGRKGQQPYFLEQESLSVVVDYDVSDEEDELVYTSFDTAPTSNLQSQSKGAIDRGDSVSEFVATSPVVTGVSKSTHDSSDFLISSLEPVNRIPMRRVSSTPVIGDRQKAGASMPPLDPGRPLSPPQQRSRAMSISTPYAFKRHSSFPATADEFTSPAILFTDDSQAQGAPKDRNRGSSIFRTGRSGTLASPCGRPPPAKGTSPPSKGTSPLAKGTILRSPLARKYRFEDSLPSPKRISSPYAFQRQMSLPVTADERRSEPTIWSAVDSKPLVGGEKSQKNRNRGSGIYRGGRPPTPTSVTSKASTDSEKWVTVHENRASNTDKVGSDEELALNLMSGDVEEGTQKASMDDVDHYQNSPSEPSTKSNDATAFFQRHTMLYVLYISAFSIFGSTIRVMLGRLFGSDCETSDAALGQFCVTANGQTVQRGGALFTDLPANVFGCFAIGLMTSLKQPGVWPTLPWFRHDHPLQQHDAYHVGIRTGLCGCITTFSSWNSQMIIMMDGTDTQLGSQIVAALFGYVIGFFCSVSSFMVGTHVAAWLIRLKNPDIAHEDDEKLRLNPVEFINHHEGESIRRRHMRITWPTPPQRIVVFPRFLSSEDHFCRRWQAKGRMPFVIVVVLLAGYAIGGFAAGNTFCRTMFVTSIFSPPGAVLRWQLYKWNSRISSLGSKRMDWLPWGTFVANILASCVCALLLAVQTRFFSDAGSNSWAVSLLTGLEKGFAGSLSTVSTMVKEMFELNSKFPYHSKAYLYATLTVVSSIVLGLCFYSPIIRSQ